MTANYSASRWNDTRHVGTIEEWVFGAWTPDGSLGVVSGHRIIGATAWYWAALARSGHPLLHITDFDVPVRADPFIVKGEAMWAEHFRDDPMHQWSVGNETYAASFEDPNEALGRGYGTPTPIAFDLEWYAVAAPSEVEVAGGGDGYEQRGVVHGAIEILGEPKIELVEVPGHRWHRWIDEPMDGPRPELGVVSLPVASAHTAARAPFRFPNDIVLDMVLTPHGWGRRRTR